MKNRVPIITTSLIGAGLLAVATFVSVGQNNLAAQPDPAHAAHVAAAANQTGGQTVEAQMAEMLARIQQLEAITQQQPGQSPAAGTMPMGAGNSPRMKQMPGMGSGTKPMQGGMAGMGGGPAVADQLAELHAKMQRLEATIQQQSGSTPGAMPMSGQPGMGSGAMPMQGGMAGMSGTGAPGAMPPAGGMGGMGGDASPPAGGMGMMGMMDKMMGGMGGGAPAAGAPMGGTAPGGGMGMMDMAKMEMAGMMGMMGGSMAMPSALPGFPGASHLYHIGATGFFLDHPQHIALSTEQQMRLNQIRQQAALDKASASRSVQEAEQDLWTLTAADQPDNAQIEAKVAEIEKLKGDARLRFIGAIGGAAKILNDEQRKALTGFAPPASAAPAAAPMAGGMKGM
jgi:Spy/CpxP family protein refolding chaperone